MNDVLDVHDGNADGQHANDVGLNIEDSCWSSASMSNLLGRTWGNGGFSWKLGKHPISYLDVIRITNDVTSD